MTPRRIAAYVILATQRINEERADELSLGAMASRGDPKALDQIRDKLMGVRRR